MSSLLSLRQCEEMRCIPTTHFTNAPLQLISVSSYLQLVINDILPYPGTLGCFATSLHT